MLGLLGVALIGFGLARRRRQPSLRYRGDAAAGLKGPSLPGGEIRRLAAQG
jgi:hypothetical protein